MFMGWMCPQHSCVQTTRQALGPRFCGWKSKCALTFDSSSWVLCGWLRLNSEMPCGGTGDWLFLAAVMTPATFLSFWINCLGLCALDVTAPGLPQQHFSVVTALCLQEENAHDLHFYVFLLPMIKNKYPHLGSTVSGIFSDFISLNLTAQNLKGR